MLQRLILSIGKYSAPEKNDLHHGYASILERQIAIYQ
jgi:hypothetical protein